MIVDASVALKWFLDEPQLAEARALIVREDLKAPDTIVTEVLNGLRKAVRDGRITLELAREAVRKLELAIPTIVPCSLVAEQALELSVKLGHPVYDCIYLACAMEMDATLVTADEEFVAVARAVGLGQHIVLLGAAV